MLHFVSRGKSFVNTENRWAVECSLSAMFPPPFWGNPPLQFNLWWMKILMFTKKTATNRTTALFESFNKPSNYGLSGKQLLDLSSSDWTNDALSGLMCYKLNPGVFFSLLSSLATFFLWQVAIFLSFWLSIMSLSYSMQFVYCIASLCLKSKPKFKLFTTIFQAEIQKKNFIKCLTNHFHINNSCFTKLIFNKCWCSGLKEEKVLLLPTIDLFRTK